MLLLFLFLFLLLLLLLTLEPREARQGGRVKPRRGGAQGCAPFSEQQDAASENSRLACGPNGSIVGRDAGWPSFGYFSLPFKEKPALSLSKGDSRKARNAFHQARAELKNKARSKAPLLNPPLRCAQGRRPEQEQRRSRSKA